MNKLRTIPPGEEAGALGIDWQFASCMLGGVPDAEGLMIASLQSERLVRLLTEPASIGDLPPLPDDLFIPHPTFRLGKWTCALSEMSAAHLNSEGATLDSVVLQLLPVWVGASSQARVAKSWQSFQVGAYRVYTLDEEVASRLRSSRDRSRSFSTTQSVQFARSANYMGSKAALASSLSDILDSYVNLDVPAIDLMCGSGVMAGAFARSRPTFASDAQQFSRLLAKVQGGGMSKALASSVAQEVIVAARANFAALPEAVLKKIEDERALINTEITDALESTVLNQLATDSQAWFRQHLNSLEIVHDRWSTGTMISHLYGGIFFGHRQAAEIDCLRRAIDSQVSEGPEREWALGALICAASACAYTYGGHFAQPRLDATSDGQSRGDLRAALQQRSLSVTHEFFVRFVSLAEESEKSVHKVELLPGPWKQALDAVTLEQACVYFDPPYTRDEYSRYYHVLEVLARYEPLPVFGKGRLPQRGTAARFPSEFSVRNPAAVQGAIVNVVRSVLNRGWSCLWSYSNIGTASMGTVLRELDTSSGEIAVHSVQHTHRSQGRGRGGGRAVSEYAIMFMPR
jgi:adenine-specific DNA-methyltransferase